MSTKDFKDSYFSSDLFGRDVIIHSSANALVFAVFFCSNPYLWGEYKGVLPEAWIGYGLASLFFLLISLMWGFGASRLWEVLPSIFGCLLDECTRNCCLCKVISKKQRYLAKGKEISFAFESIFPEVKVAYKKAASKDVFEDPVSEMAGLHPSNIEKHNLCLEYVKANYQNYRTELQRLWGIRAALSSMIVSSTILAFVAYNSAGNCAGVISMIVCAVMALLAHMRILWTNTRDEVKMIVFAALDKKMSDATPSASV